jgi:hypothetical protein
VGLAATDPTDARAKRDLARSLTDLAALATATNDWAASEAAAAEAAAILRLQGQLDPKNQENVFLLAEALEQQGVAQFAGARTGPGAASLGEALALYRGLASSSPADTYYPEAIARVERALAGLRK